MFAFSGAQTEKGKFVVSGSTGLNFISSNIKYEYDGVEGGDFKQSSFSFTPSAGYFVMDNLAVGLAANFSSNSIKDDDGDKDTVSSTAFLPTVLYYFPVEGDFKPLVQAGVGYMSTVEKEQYGSQTDEYKYSGLAVSVGVGAAYFISETVSFNIGLGYTMANLKYDEDSNYVQKQGSFVGSLGISVFL